MLKLTLSAFAASLLSLSLIPEPAQAQPARVFVAAQGLDSNPCTFALPCRTFQHAHDVVAANGEIDVLDPAGYGALTVTKSISIQGHGFAGLAVTSGKGVTINAGSTDVVNLNGLLIDGIGLGLNGIVFNTGQWLTIENCVIRRFTGAGLMFSPSASSSLAVSSTQVANNGSYGIDVFPSGSGFVTAVFNRVEVTSNVDIGIAVNSAASTGTVNVTVTESIAAGISNGIGFGVSSLADHAPTTLMVFHSVAANNNVGLFAGGTGAVLNLAYSMVTGNANGWFTGTGGVLQSYGDNYIDGNASSQTAPPSIAKK